MIQIFTELGWVKTDNNGFIPLIYFGEGYLSIKISKLELHFLYSCKTYIISSGLEPVLIHTKKICLALYHIQFSTKIKTGFIHISAKSCL